MRREYEGIIQNLSSKISGLEALTGLHRDKFRNLEPKVEKMMEEGAKNKEIDLTVLRALEEPLSNADREAGNSGTTGTPVRPRDADLPLVVTRPDEVVGCLGGLVNAVSNGPSPALEVSHCFFIYSLEFLMIAKIDFSEKFDWVYSHNGSIQKFKLFILVFHWTI